MRIPGFLKLKRTWIGLALVVLLIGGVLFMQNKAAADKAKADAEAAAAPESPYAAIANGRADVEGGVIQVAARRGGIVREVLVQEGESVTQGQILARQEDDEPRLALQRAQAEVQQAESALALTRVELNGARREYERLERLVATNFVAAQRIDQARDAIASAEATIQSQQAAVQTARARLNEAAYNLELTVVRAPVNGRIVRRYANPGAGASTLNVTAMFDLEPQAPRIVRAEIVESDIPNVVDGQEVEIVSENDPSKVYVGRVIRRAPLFGARKLQSDDPSQRTDERVVEVVVSADDAPLLIGQRVLVKFMKDGHRAGATPPSANQGVPPDRAMQQPAQS